VRRTVVFVALIFVATAVHLILSPSQHLDGTGSHGISRPMNSSPAHSKPELAKPLNSEAFKNQFKLLKDPIIHSRAEFQPHQHLPTYPPYTCQCIDQDGSPFASLVEASKEIQTPLDTPVRIVIPNTGVTRPLIGNVLSDVYVANLPARTDRLHYMCAVLEHLKIPAILWPAFPKRHIMVRSFATQVKLAKYNPLLDYSFLRPRPPPTPSGPANTSLPHAMRTIPGPHFRTSQVACYLSHREIWLDVVRRQLPKSVLVLEDDVDIEEEFVPTMEHALEALPDNWAVLWVGSCFEEMRAHSDKIGHRCGCLISEAVDLRHCTAIYSLDKAAPLAQ
jgi:hypothetical protein